jgi:hypothetical protein
VTRFSFWFGLLLFFFAGVSIVVSVVVLLRTGNELKHRSPRDVPDHETKALLVANLDMPVPPYPLGDGWAVRGSGERLFLGRVVMSTSGVVPDEAYKAEEGAEALRDQSVAADRPGSSANEKSRRQTTETGGKEPARKARAERASRIAPPQIVARRPCFVNDGMVNFVRRTASLA